MGLDVRLPGKLIFSSLWILILASGCAYFYNSVSGPPTFTLLYSFAGGTSDGADPYHDLIQGNDGDFYGTTYQGGAGGIGTVFKITPSGTTETTLYSFAGSSSSYAGLIQGSDGNFYGTTYYGGTSGYGTVFRVTPSGTGTTLYSFAGGSDGANPYAALIRGSDGNLYGTTFEGGTSGYGTVFEITSGGTETVLYSFAGGTSDGAYPKTGLILGSDGNFYGTTYQGGTSGYGTVFEITPTSGTETVLHSFAGGTSDGAYPDAGVTQGSDGNFYGTTYQGGTSNDGTVFEITPTSGTETVLHSFAGGTSDGANPYARVIQGSDGNFYGTTSQGGISGYGTIFEIMLSGIETTPSGTETVLHSFAGGSSDGKQPWAGLSQGSDGNLYGATVAGGANGYGTFFKLTFY